MNEKNVTHLSVEEMQRLLADRCPGMSSATRSAVLQGAELTLKDGSTYQIPNAVRDGKATHHTRPVVAEKVGTTWKQ